MEAYGLWSVKTRVFAETVLTKVAMFCIKVEIRTTKLL